VLRRPLGRPGPGDGHGVEGRVHEEVVVDVGSGDGDADRHAAPLSEHRALDPALAAVGGVGAGFSPHPRGPCPWRRPGTATSSRCRPRRRRPAGPPARTPRTLRPASPPGTGDGPRTRCRSRWRSGRSTGTRCAAQKDRVHRLAIGRPRIVATQGMGRTRRQQRLYPRPQIVGQTIAIVQNRRLARSALARFAHPIKIGQPTPVPSEIGSKSLINTATPHNLPARRRSPSSSNHIEGWLNRKRAPIR